MKRTALLLTAIVLTACSGPQTKYGAAEDVRAFILAVRENDQAAFERHVDRAALRTQVLAELKSSAGPLADMLGESFAEQAVDQMIRPESFRALLEQSGAPARTPTAAEIATQLRVLEDGRVCLPRAPEGPCAATFAEQGRNWRLVALDVSDVNLGGGAPAPAESTAR